MRRRYQVNLSTDHPRHLDLIEHLMQFDKYKRSGELTMLLLAGYQALYGKGDGLADKSSSILLEERDMLMNLILQRHQAPAPTGSTQRHEQVPAQEAPGGGYAPPAPRPSPVAEERRSDPVPAAQAAPLPTASKPESAKKPEPAPVYRDEDLTDEDPSIAMSEGPNLDEDVVDPLSLFE